MFGVDEAVKSVRDAVGAFGGKGVELVLVTGPPGSGKTTIVNEALEAHDYVVYMCTAGESVSKESEKALRFCKTSHSVEALINGTTSRRRAVFLDDSLPDTKSIAAVYDLLKREKCSVLVVATLNMSAKAPEVRRRASRTVVVRYPCKQVVVAFLRDQFGESAGDETYSRCADASGGSVMKAVRLVQGEMYGTLAEEPARGGDTTIFDDVARGLSYSYSGRHLKDVEAAVSNEPSMAAMILRESIPHASPGTRGAFRMLSKTPPGTWIGALAATVAFAETAARERGALESAPLKFPRCYTTTSSRSSNTKKRIALGR